MRRAPERLGYWSLVAGGRWPAFERSRRIAAAEHLWRVHKREKKIRGDRDRRTFLAGVMLGVWIDRAVTGGLPVDQRRQGGMSCTFAANGTAAGSGGG